MRQNMKPAQLSDIPITRINVTIVKKDKKEDNKALNHVKCFAYHKKSHYANKYPNKES